MPSEDFERRREFLLGNMRMFGVLNDKFIPPDDFDLLLNHHYSEWTPELRVKVRPYAILPLDPSKVEPS